MSRQLSSNNTSSVSLASTSAFSQFHGDPLARTGSPRISNPTTSPSAHNYAYLMTTSPTAGRRPSVVDYRPSTKTARGHVPACLVNASVTYYGNDQIYAFGGFDQFTDEGPSLFNTPIALDSRANISAVYNHVLKLDLNTLVWELVDNYGDIPGVRMGCSPHSLHLFI